ncbi:MAG TPA: hypothetical protein VEA69_25845, partial [Tepidisphaeraceae bacterium]|nr:hypothetical protein [Tepidisphaeraceae bacterium]
MRTTKTLAAVWALSVLTIALPARAADYPETPDGLKNLNEDILAALKAGEKEKAAALVKGLVLVDHAEWLKKTFGEELGTKI